MSLQQHQQPSSVFPGSLSQNDWAALLQDNQEAQDLLSGAIAHHHQHYPVDDDSRRTISHLHHKSDRYDNEPKSATSGAYSDGLQYSEGDNSSDDTNAAIDGKPAPKKAGRKPLTTEPTNKRKAQNRAAQRAFRERKERYVKSLEDRIKELEEQQPNAGGGGGSNLAEENMNLKVLVQKLETENYFLKEQSFTFDFPISQPGLYNVSKIQRDAAPVKSHVQEPSVAALTSTTAVQPANGKISYTTVSSKTVGGDRLPWTPPSSGGDSVPNSPLDSDLPTPEQDTNSHVSYSDNAGVVPSRYHTGTPESMALFSSLLDGSGNTYNNAANLNHYSSVTNAMNPSNNHDNVFGTNNNRARMKHFMNTSGSQLDASSPASTLAMFSEHSPSPSLEDIVNTPLFETDNEGKIHLTPRVGSTSGGSLTFEQTQALFTDFRDPSDPRDFFTGFDDAVEASFPGNTVEGGLFNDPLVDYASTFTDVSPPISSAKVQPVSVQETTGTIKAAPCGEIKRALPPLADGEKAIPCPQAWEHIAKHPKFDDADIDDLCSQLQSKAKCSGHGPVIALSDVDAMMSRLDQE
ncbi:DNA-binding transcription factor yap1 [Dissophora globulifera]|uniref:DNA-binding transcription factor yap1 n=1 Tax=Dissophora globulifera TaxID=979702 RepID=A0A9P6R3X6_9FUNG|nr:DNA-binding transcription factor yap1 [Dissophora globulifera]